MTDSQVTDLIWNAYRDVYGGLPTNGDLAFGLKVIERFVQQEEGCTWPTGDCQLVHRARELKKLCDKAERE